MHTCRMLMVRWRGMSGDLRGERLTVSVWYCALNESWGRTGHRPVRQLLRRPPEIVTHQKSSPTRIVSSPPKILWRPYNICRLLKTAHHVAHHY